MKTKTTLLMLVIAAVLLSYGCREDTAVVVSRHAEDGQRAAEGSVMNSYQYSELGGYNLRMASYRRLDCTECFEFTYIFDVDTYDLPEYITGFEARVTTEHGVVVKTEFIELGEAVEEVDLGCINMCGDGICQEVVCLGSECPCPEDEITCPEDCPQR
jgi:hypothetical protein